MKTPVAFAAPFGNQTNADRQHVSRADREHDVRIGPHDLAEPERVLQVQRHALLVEVHGLEIVAVAGPQEMRAHVEELSQIAECYTSAYPNAGLPNAMGEYDEHPADTAHFIEDWAKEGFVNIVGGCCGTTPDHIRHIAAHVKALEPRQIPQVRFEDEEIEITK